MSKTRLYVDIDGNTELIELVAGDYFRVNREIQLEGSTAADTPAYEYRARLAHRALRRLGKLPVDSDFLTWADDLEDVEDQEARDEEAGDLAEGPEEGEAEATPAN